MAASALEKHRDLGLLIARIGFGLGFFWFHGRPKLADPERWAQTGRAVRHFGVTFAPEFWGLLAGIAEGVGGLLVAAGLFFRPAVVAIFAVMVVASVNHIVTGQGTPAHALKNAFLFAGLFFIGPGRYSLDHWLAERRRAGRR